MGGSSANTVTMQAGSTLQFWDTVAAPVWSLALNSNVTVTAGSGSGTMNTWAGPVTLNSLATFTCAGTIPLSVSGAITGTGPLVKAGASTVTLTGANTYGGGTVVTDGTLALSGTTSTLGAATGSLTVDGSTAIVNLGATLQTVGAVNLLSGGQITGTGTLTAPSSMWKAARSAPSSRARAP